MSTQTVVERAQQEAKRKYPFLTDWSDAPRRMGFLAGATFAATITPEQVEAFKRGWEEADARGESGSRVLAGLRAMGFQIEGDDER